MSNVALSVNGKVFEGWEQVSVVKGIEACAGGFSLQVSDVNPWPIKNGAKCALSLDGEQVISGWVDRVEIDMSDDTHVVSVAGRDAAGDLVDCGVDHKTGEYLNQDLLQITKSICAPFGVAVKVDGATIGAKFPKYSIQPGETAWQAIERACRSRGVLVVSDNVGGIVLTKPKNARAGAALVYGQNVKAFKAKFDDSDRFKTYIVRGQTAGTDNLFGDAAASVSASAGDSGVERYRPMIILAEGNMVTSQAKDRARYEATVRAARAGRITVTVVGWRRSEAGKLWAFNELVDVDIPPLKMKGDMLISGVRFSLDESGTITELDLVRPDGFTIEPIVFKNDSVKSDTAWSGLFQEDEE